MSQKATVSDNIEQDTSQMAPTPTIGTSIPVDTSKEIPVHTQQLNFIDPILREQFVVTQQGSWSSNMTAGYTLFRIPVHPSAMNQYVKYLSALYGVWGGSVEAQVVIAGTGFNGGKLLFVKTPPYVDSRKFTLQDLMIFPNRIIDVKAQDAFGIIGQDQRPIEYHQVNAPPANFTLTVDNNFMEMTSTGGWISLVVLNPLIAANMSSGSVTWTLMTRLGQDFQFNQMVPPQINTNVPKSYPTIYNDMVKKYNGYVDIEFDTLMLSTKSTDTHTTRAGLVNTDGEFIVDSNWFNIHLLEGKTIEKFDNTGTYKVKTKDMNAFKYINLAMDGVYSMSNTVPVKSGTDMTFTPDDVRFKSDTLTNDPGKVQNAFMARPQDIKVRTIRSTGWAGFPAFSANRNECFCYFNSAAGPDGYGMFQDSQLAAFCTFFKPGTSMDVVFVVRQKTNDAPLAYLRLNHGGYLTCPTSTTMKKYALDNIYLQFFSEIEPNASLPEISNDMMVNDQLYHINAAVRELSASATTPSIEILDDN